MKFAAEFSTVTWRRRSRQSTRIVELSNAVEAMYVPTRAAYAGGSYEVTNSAVEAGSGEMLVEAALRLLREIAAAQVKAGQK